MILVRDTLSHGGTRLPDWLAGCRELQRVQTDCGDVLTAGDPLFITIPPHLAWHDLGDGWQVTSNGGVDHDRYMRMRPDIETAPVRDAQGKMWAAPIVLDQQGHCAMPLPWGKVDGIRMRCPTAEQQRLINASEAARAEILAQRLDQVPINIIAEWVHALLAATYHLSGDVIDALQIMDDNLAAGVLLAASGYPRPIPVNDV